MRPPNIKEINIRKPITSEKAAKEFYNLAILGLKDNFVAKDYQLGSYRRIHNKIQALKTFLKSRNVGLAFHGEKTMRGALGIYWPPYVNRSGKRTKSMIWLLNSMSIENTYQVLLHEIGHYLFKYRRLPKKRVRLSTIKRDELLAESVSYLVYRPQTFEVYEDSVWFFNKYSLKWNKAVALISANKKKDKLAEYVNLLRSIVDNAK